MYFFVLVYVLFRTLYDIVFRAVLQLNSWLMQIGLATVGQNGDMGANLSSARDFLELHERLSEDMKVTCHLL